MFKGRSPTIRHVSRTHRVALDWVFDRINSDPKIQFKYIDTKTNLTTFLKEISHVTEWNHLLCLFYSYCSSAECSEVMSKRTQKESGEERVTAKSRPIMSLIAKVPSNLSSSTSESPVKKLWKSDFLEFESWERWWNGATRCNFLGNDSRVPIKFLSWEDTARWNSAVRGERGKSSW